MSTLPQVAAVRDRVLKVTATFTVVESQLSELHLYGYLEQQLGDKLTLVDVSIGALKDANPA